MPLPLLFLDVDGPLLPFGAPESPTGTSQPATSPTLLDRLDPELGPRLSALPCELVWATTWVHEANEALAPLLGLPALPVVEWPDDTDHRVDDWFGLHWKTRSLLTYARDRPFIWIDDELTEQDIDYVTRNHPAPALLHRVDPRVGLRPADFDTLEPWLASH
ncbi:HAD domain-containing protein [Nocardia sp. NPDC055321]